jgi:hypothetical protein
VLAGFFERSYLLAQFVAAGLKLLGLSDGFATASIEGEEITQQCGRVGIAEAQLCFDEI